MRIDFSDRFITNATIILWAMFIVIICTVVAYINIVRPGVNCYFDAASLWIKGKNIYNGSWDGFIYLPQAAILMIPFAYLTKFSYGLAEIVLRLIMLSSLAFAIWRFSNLVEKKYIAKTFFIVTIVTLSLVFSSARNGQFNVITTVMMMLAVCAVAQEKWSQATFFLVLGLALKPIMIVLLLMLWVLYRSLWWRLPLGLFVILIYPFFTKSPKYVVAQYISSIEMLKITSVYGSNFARWAQFFGILAPLKIVLPQVIQDAIRATVAIFVLYCGYIIKRKFNKNYAAIFLFTLAACYLMLFNPRTENNSYCIIAPTIGIFISLFFAYNVKKQALLFMFIVIGLIMAGNFAFIMDVDGNTGGYDFWSAPFFTLIFTIIVIKQIFSSNVFIKRYLR